MVCHTRTAEQVPDRLSSGVQRRREPRQQRREQQET
jgi:hypothetical protein